MKILLDECLPKQLARLLSNHEVQTVAQAGWAGIKNGELLKLAQGKFDVFLTIDQNLMHQQNTSKCDMGFLVLRSKSNDIELLRPLIPKILETLEGGVFRGVKFIET